MPRPKRAKVAPSAPTLRVAKPTATSQAKQKHATLSPASSGRVTNPSDDSEGLVKTNKTGRNRKGIAAREATMSGALPPEDVALTRLRPPTGRARAALSQVVRDADHSKAVEAMKARRNVAAAAEKGDELQIPSSMPVERISAENVSLRPANGTTLSMSVLTKASQPLAMLKAGTPLRQESSLLGGAAFKKRPRQPSLLQLIRNQDQNNLSVGDEDDDLDDFRPDDESTPFLKSLSQSNIHQTPLPASSSSQNLSGSRKRKLTTSEVQVPMSQSLSSPTSSPSQLPQQGLFALPADSDSELALPFDVPSGPSPTLPPPRRTEISLPEVWSETEAPPQSSSPLPRQLQSTKPRNTRTTNPALESKPPTQSTRKRPSPAPSPLSSTSSRAPSPALVSYPSLKPLMTATLQNLLPRRRLRPGRSKGAMGGEFDIPNSSDPEIDDTPGLDEEEDRDEDEDELSSYAVGRKTKKRGAGLPAAKRNPLKPRRPMMGKPQTQLQVQAPAKGRTYGRHPKKPSQTEQENQPNTDRTSSPNPSPNKRGISAAPAAKAETQKRQAAKKALQRVAMKFKEVDDWVLEMEEVTGNSSSQPDAR